MAICFPIGRAAADQFPIPHSRMIMPERLPAAYPIPLTR